MNDRKPYIEFEHVRKAFGSKVVIDDVSFDVMPGETVCILGRSGVGKSVSLQMIMGFLRADSGTIRVAYDDVRISPRHRWKRCARRSPWSSKTERSSIR